MEKIFSLRKEVQCTREEYIEHYKLLKDSYEKDKLKEYKRHKAKMEKLNREISRCEILIVEAKVLPIVPKFL